MAREDADYAAASPASAKSPRSGQFTNMCFPLGPHTSVDFREFMLAGEAVA
jgi:hypothetical protein